MQTLLNILVALIALLHLGFLYLEMFLWQTPTGQKIFKTTAQFAQESATLAANQGLYNGFLVAGLVWSIIHPNPQTAFQLKLFFLGCVIVAGFYGWWTVSRNILFAQALPATLVLALCLTQWKSLA